jgi:hypothetical protein
MISSNRIHAENTMRKPADWLVPPQGIIVDLSGLCLLKATGSIPEEKPCTWQIMLKHNKISGAYGQKTFH